MNISRPVTTFIYNKNNTTVITGINSILDDSSISTIALINKIYKHRQKQKTTNIRKTDDYK
jgi:hypothetical protein